MSSRVLIASWLNLDEDPDEPLPSGWIEPLVPMRKRVLRNGSTTWPAIELPDIDMLESLADHEARRPGDDCAAIDDEGQQAERERRSGAGAIAWAVAYRDGLEQGRREGHAEGLAQGRREGTAAARDEGRLLATQAIEAIAAEIDQVLLTLEKMVADVASEATSLGLGVAEAVLDNELRTSANPGADAIARAVRLLPDSASNGSDRLMIHLNPDDVVGLGEVEPVLIAGRSVEIVADGEVASGSCRMELGATRLDASVDAALARVRSVLSC